MQKLLLEQAGLSAQAQLKATTHKSELLILIDGLADLRDIQSGLVKAKAKEDLEQAKELALTFEIKNAGIEEKIEGAKKEQAPLQELAKKHKKLYKQLETAEKELRKKVQANREEINPLVVELKSLQGSIKKLDEEKEKQPEK